MIEVLMIVGVGVVVALLIGVVIGYALAHPSAPNKAVEGWKMPDWDEEPYFPETMPCAETNILLPPEGDCGICAATVTTPADYPDEFWDKLEAEGLDKEEK